MTLLPLVGVLIIVAGFALRLNPLIVIVAAAFGAGLAGGLAPLRVLEVLGHAWNQNRFISVTFLILPLIGVLERSGLQERAKALVGQVSAASAGRVLMLYFLFRQITAAVGLLALAGHAQMVRPLVAPMAEAAAERRAGGRLTPALRWRVRAVSAATENCAVLYGEDVFLAVSSILLIKGLLAQAGHDVDPLRLSLYAVPGAIVAAVITAVRLWRLDRGLARDSDPSAEPAPAGRAA